MKEPEKQPIVSKAQSHIIERPRLTKLLDETQARIIALVAPAGYGKTTLARQWLSGKPFTRYRATAASADVAALAIGIADTTSLVVPNAGEALRRRLSAAQAPEMKAETMAEMLAMDLDNWPPEAWLMIDDYHLVDAGSSAANFVDALTSISEVRMLLTSRERPRWISSRRLLYGEILELGHANLALTDDEALSVLHSDNTQRTRKLLDHARGWPAVIGLAALTRDFDLPDRPLPLYDFFADELYRHATEDLQLALRRIAALPVVTEEFATVAIGTPARAVLEEATRLGFVSADAADGYELHPLLRQFLVNKLRDAHDDIAFLDSVAELLMQLDRWDEVFSLIEQFGLETPLHQLLDHGLSAILRVGRLATVERWVEHARAASIESPLEYLAEAEIARRRGFPQKGEIYALQAAQILAPTDPRTSQAYAVAGECAHTQMRFDDALRHHGHAEELAQCEDDRRRAIWGQFIGSWASEGDFEGHLRRLGEVAQTDTSARLRVASGHLLMAVLSGSISNAVDIWGRLLPLVDKAEDPLARSFYSYLTAAALSWSGRYAEALPVVSLARREAASNGFDFAMPHVANVEIAARIGLRQFTRAGLLIDDSIDRYSKFKDAFTGINTQMWRVRLALVRGRISDARRWSDFDLDRAPNPAHRGEALAVRALALAAFGERKEALRAACEAISVTRAMEARTLGSLVQAIVAMDVDSRVRAQRMLQEASSVLGGTENFDSFVIAYRLFPTLLDQLRPTENWRTTLETVLTRANDHKLGVKAKILAEQEPEALLGLPLSRREREVFELMCHGLTNKEIADRLFITEVTAKAHVRKILAKLGVRSRTEAVLRAHGEE